MPFPLARIASLLWPVRIWKGLGAHGPLEVVWEYGRLVVNSANANQSHGSLHHVWQQAMRDANIAERDPSTALLLGFGAGSVARILLDELELRTAITGVDDDPVMLRIAREHFGFAHRKEVHLHQADVFHFVTHAVGTYDLICVDLFHDRDMPPQMTDPAFISDLRRLASPGGLVLLNTMVYSPAMADLSTRLRQELRHWFTEVKERAYEGDNRVFIAL